MPLDIALVARIATEAAKTGLAQSVKSGAMLVSADTFSIELGCEQCASVLLKPTTLGDGRTVCVQCAPRVARLQGEQAAGFGTQVNTLLETIIKVCLPDGHAGAETRAQGNAEFTAGDHAAAAALYVRAAEIAPFDLVPQLNLSVALLKMGDVGGAVRPAGQCSCYILSS